jgi:hypothetical protein
MGGLRMGDLPVEEALRQNYLGSRVNRQPHQQIPRVD